MGKRFDLLPYLAQWVDLRKKVDKASAVTPFSNEDLSGAIIMHHYHQNYVQFKNSHLLLTALSLKGLISLTK